MAPLCQYDHFTVWSFQNDRDHPILLIRTSDGVGMCIIFGTTREHLRLGLQYTPGNGFDAAIELARNVPSRTVFMQPQTAQPIPCLMEPDDFPGPFLGLVSPHFDLPIFDKPSLFFCPNFLSSRRVEPVQLGPRGIPYLFKSIHHNGNGLQNLQEEVNNYVGLRNSSHILPIRGLVRCDDWSFELSHSGAPDPVQRRALCGFLIPFCGAHSMLWYPNEWTSFEKEVLAVALLDAVLDIELRGVNLSDLKGANVLVTPRGLRLIDIDARTVTFRFHSPFTCRGSVATVYNFGRTLSELFSEEQPSGDPDAGTSVKGATPIMRELILSCCQPTRYNSMKDLYDATFEMLRPIRSRTDITVSTLAELRNTRLRMQAQSFQEAWLGCSDDITSWDPDFKEQKFTNVRSFDTTGKYCQTIWCTNFNQPVEHCKHLSHIHPVYEATMI